MNEYVLPDWKKFGCGINISSEKRIHEKLEFLSREATLWKLMYMLFESVDVERRDIAHSAVLLRTLSEEYSRSILLK